MKKRESSDPNEKSFRKETYSGMAWGGGGPISEEFSNKGPGIKHAAGTRMASFLALFGSVFEGWATDTRGIRCWDWGSAPKAAWNPEQTGVICGIDVYWVCPEPGTSILVQRTTKVLEDAEPFLLLGYWPRDTPVQSLAASGLGKWDPPSPSRPVGGMLHASSLPAGPQFAEGASWQGKEVSSLKCCPSWAGEWMRAATCPTSGVPEPGHVKRARASPSLGAQRRTRPAVLASPSACWLASRSWQHRAPVIPSPPARPSPLPAFLVASQLRVTPGSNILGLLQTTQLAMLRAVGLVKAKMPPFTAWLFPSSSSSSPLFLFFSFFNKRDGPFGELSRCWGGKGSRQSLSCGRVWSGPLLLLFFKMIVYRKIKFKGECPSRRKD